MDPYNETEPGDDAPEDPLDALADAASDQWEQSHTRESTIDGDGRINADVYCVGCEYNLRGQLPEGACPECGVPVAESNRSDRLSEADVYWLRTLQKATTWLIIAAVTVFLLGCVNGGVTSALSGGGSVIASVIELLFSAVQALLFCVGYWLLTTPEPGALRQRFSRPLTRWTILGGYAISFPALLIAIPGNRVLDIISMILEVASGCAVLVGTVAALVYLRTLARRVPDRRLAKSTTIVMWGWSCSIGALIVGAIVVFGLAALSLPGNPSGAGSFFSLVMLVACPLGIALLVFFIWWIVLITTYGQCLGRAAKTSHRRR